MGLLLGINVCVLGITAEDEVQKYLNDFRSGTLKINGKEFKELILEKIGPARDMPVKNLSFQQLEKAFPDFAKDQLNILMNYLKTVIIPQNDPERGTALLDAMNQAMTKYLQGL